MFILTEEPRFTHDVKVMTPIDGGHREDIFKATYRVIDVEEIGDTAGLAGQQALLRRVVVGIDDVVDANKKAVPYSDEFRDRLIAIPYIRAGLLQTYLAAITRSAVGN